MGQDAAQEYIVPFLGALQASVAVLLTIFTGVIASQFQLIGEPASKEISKVCVRLFLPALLIVNVGEQLHAGTVRLSCISLPRREHANGTLQAIKYVPIIVWSIVYQLLSLLIGYGLSRVMSLPSWATPALAFNNTTSLPLLLVQALDAAGILDSIDDSSDVVARAKSYFLVNAMVSNSLTFAIGPKFLDCPGDLDGSESEPKNDEDEDALIESQEQEAEQTNEQTSLLPRRVADGYTRAGYSIYARAHRLHRALPSWGQHFVNGLNQFVNPPVIGTALGAVIGLVPALHTLFFSDQSHGGYFNAWLTSALKNVGDLFAALQVIVVGIKLSTAMLKWKKGEASGTMPWGAFTLITFVRFVLWPAISIPLIYVFATKTGTLAEDPMLWFAMMLMPTGPPALSLTAMADVSGAGEEEKLSIAKFLTVSNGHSVLNSVKYEWLTLHITGIICRFATYMLRSRWELEGFAGCCFGLSRLCSSFAHCLSAVWNWQTCDAIYQRPRCMQPQGVTACHCPLWK
jgi:predicted permease